MITNVESPAPAVEDARARIKSERWIQLIIGIVCMVMIANLQYGWTLFVTPIGKAHGWNREDIQWAFTIFVVAETWLVPLEGMLVDKFGPRVVVLGGGLLAGLGWALDSRADSLTFLYFSQIVCGIGAGAVYGTCVGNALKWFPERRGLAAGLTAAGFGIGSALTIIPISKSIDSAGYESTFLYFGIGQGLVIFALAWLLHQPDANTVAALPKPVRVNPSQRQYKWQEILKTPVFWVMYVMFTFMAAGGLFVTANLAQIGEDFHLKDTPVTILGVTMAAVPFALAFDRVTNGLTRPFFGWVSDKLGRENTMFLAFVTEAIAITLMSQFGSNPTAFVVLTALIYFAWGEIYSLFPSTSADTFGWQYASGNYGLLYTAKGMASLIVPYATKVVKVQGWGAVLLIAAGLALVSAISSLALLKPMRRRMNLASK